MADPSADDITSVREKIGESIPAGGSASDTLFTDAQVKAWISNPPNLNSDSTFNLYRAAIQGWDAKMAAVANLVDVTDGASQRKLSDLFAHAQQMIKRYEVLAVGPSHGRTRVGKIRRPWDDARDC